MEEQRVEWVNSIQLHEVAEAVKTTTELVMAVHSSGIVLYTPEGTEEIWRCLISRDADGIAVAGPGTFLATFDQFQEEMKSKLDERFREMEERGELPPRSGDDS